MKSGRERAVATSDRKVQSNRVNGRKGAGPKNTSSTRFNATKHALLALGVTEIDNREGYRRLVKQLRDELKPAGTREEFLVESVSLEILRLRRARRLEAEYITAMLNPP